MKTVKFILEHCIERPKLDDIQIAKYLVPILPAYAIEYAELKTYSGIDAEKPTEYIEGRGFEIKKDVVVWNDYAPSLLEETIHPILIAHTHGIRDTRLLFPAVLEPARQDGLARYYEETDKCFEAAAWLSFMLMCGAIFEGLLYDRFGTTSKNSFVELIESGSSNSMISDEDAGLFHRVRNYQNMVHLNKAEKGHVKRADVMDTRKVLDAMVIRFSYPDGSEVRVI